MPLTKLQGQLVSNTTTLSVASANINGNLIVNSSGSIVVPVGNTAQRPASATVGSLRYNSDTGYFETYTVSGWGAIATPPTITNVSPTSYNGESGTSFTISGSFFEAASTVKFITSQGTEYSAGSVSYVNSSLLTATTPQDFTVAQEPLGVKVINGAGLSYTLSQVIDCGGSPTWNTAAGTLATYVYPTNTTYSTAVSAYDPDANSTISYSVSSGELPSGASLNTSNGLISGTISNPGSSSVTNNFDISVTDNAGNATVRSFNIIRQWADGSTQARAGVSASAIKSLTGTTSDGVYWLKPTSGSGSAFQTYCIMSRDGGGWVKAIQYNNAVDLSGSSSVNSGGSWINSEINLNAGKISTVDWTALNATNSFLFRVTGGTDNLLNNGSGTGKLAYTSTLPVFGTDLDPTSNYILYLDMTSDGSYEYYCTYTNDTRGRCGHVPSYWISDHNYNGTFNTPPPLNSVPICWTIGASAVYTNLHWMSGLATQSAGSIPWGNTSTTAFSIYIK